MLDEWNAAAPAAQEPSVADLATGAGASGGDTSDLFSLQHTAEYLSR